MQKISNFFLSTAPWHRWSCGDRQRVVRGPHAVRQEGSALRPQEQEGETQVVHGRRQGMLAHQYQLVFGCVKQASFHRFLSITKEWIRQILEFRK